MVKMLIIDDEYLVRLGIEETIDWSKYGIKIIGSAKNGKEGIKLAEELHPDIIISDVRMPIMDGLDVMKRIKEINLDTIVIMLSGYKDFEYAKETLENGAFQYLLKPIDNDQLVESVLKAVEELNLRRKNKEKIVTLEKELPLISSTIVQNLIAGNYVHIEEIKDKINRYALNVPEAGYVIYGHICQESEKRVIKDANAKIFDLIVQALKEVKAQFVSNIYYSHFVILVSNIEFNSLHQLLTSCLDIYENLFLEIVSIGLSSKFEGLNKIYEKYLEAKKNAKNKLLLTMNTITTSSDEHNRYRKLVVDAIRYISLHYQNNISIQTAAQTLNVSQSHLMHIFKEDTGHTFNECLTEYRIGKAKKLLQSEKYRIYEVASLVGYSDTKYFSQVFRKSVGLTPNDYISHKKRIS